MNSDPELQEISEADEQPATKGDVRTSQEELATMMAKSFENVATKHDIKGLDQRVSGLEQHMDAFEQHMDRFEQRLDTFDQRMERFESSQAATLKVVQSIDRQLQDLKTLPKRVERLERAVFRK